MYYQNIFGWTDFEDIYLEACNKFDNCTFVEIGSFQGKSACFMAESIKERKKNIKLVCLDLFPTKYEIQKYKNIGAGQGGDQFGEEAYINKLPESLMDTFVRNMIDAGVEDIVIPIKSNSHKAVALFTDNSIPFVFVDASHNYDQVLEDVKLWWPKVTSGGMFAGHDRWTDGVARAVSDFFEPLGITFITRGNSWLIYKA